MTTVDTEAARVDPALAEMMDAVFAEHREAYPPSATAERDAVLWNRLDDLGLVRLTGPEERGGSAAGWFEAAELLSAAVRNGVRIPLAEHDLLACWLLDVTGGAADGAARTVCLLDKETTARKVPWASTSDRVVVVWRDNAGYRLADVTPDVLNVSPGTNRIGEPRDTVSVDTAALDGVSVADGAVDELKSRSALVRAIQVCAALDRILLMCLDHAASRIQFGRPLSRFQAVQQLIADIAGEAALAGCATEAAIATAVADRWTTDRVRFQIAAARSCVGHAASVVVRNAHQVHGAIGTTREHRLHEFTRAALTWRSEFGSLRYWDDQVTAAAVSTAPRRLWGLITD